MPSCLTRKHHLRASSVLNPNSYGVSCDPLPCTLDFLSSKPMATETKPSAGEDTKVDLFEDDDEFEEFEIGEEWDEKEEGKDALQQWEDDWDDDDVSDDFSRQLRKELESHSEKK